MHPLLAKHLLLVAERLRGERVDRFLPEMEEAQWKTPKQIQGLQQARLEQLLRFTVTKNPYYREKYGGVDPVLEFNQLPLLTKDELRTSAREMITPERRARVRGCKTSGSTGEPLKFYRDGVMFGRTLAAAYRAQRWYGLDVGSPMAMLWGIPTGRWDRFQMRIRDYALNRFREEEYNLSPEVLSAFFKKMQRRKPSFIFGYSSMLYEFALFCRERELDVASLGLKAAICTAESIAPHQREVMSAVFQAPVVSEYGAAEVGIVSYQCPKGNHHVSDDTVLLELLDDDGGTVEEGEIGRVVVTALFSHAAPIIRYDLGDLAVRKRGSCPCGVGLSLLDRIVGRTSGVIVTPSGRCFHSIVIYYIMKDFAEAYGGVKQFRVRQRRLDLLEVQLVTEEGFSGEAREWLGTTLRDTFGESVRVKLSLEDELTRMPSGKLSDFQSDLNSEELLLRSYRNLSVSAATPPKLEGDR